MRGETLNQAGLAGGREGLVETTLVEWLNCAHFRIFQGNDIHAS